MGGGWASQGGFARVFSVWVEGQADASQPCRQRNQVLKPNTTPNPPTPTLERLVPPGPGLGALQSQRGVERLCGPHQTCHLVAPNSFRLRGHERTMRLGASSPFHRCRNRGLERPRPVS